MGLERELSMGLFGGSDKKTGGDEPKSNSRRNFLRKLQKEWE